MKKKAIKISITLVCLTSLVFVNISAFLPSFHEQKRTSTSKEFPVRIAQTPDPFLSIWDTTRTSTASSNSNQVALPLQSSGTYNFTVEWGDGSDSTITVWNQAEVTHTYASEGVYTINITGKIIGWRFANGGDRLKLIEIQQWGCLQLGNSEWYFGGCSNLELTATDDLNLTGTNNLRETFRDCVNLGDSGNMNGWDVSSVTTMKGMFYGASSFNQSLSNWDVSSVTDMSYMFSGASSFNQSLSNWDVSSVTLMYFMFQGASSFNQPLNSWDVSSVTSPYFMFQDASSFNQPLNNWDVSSVIDMRGMFERATSFNQPIGNWDVSSVTTMRYMFQGISLSTANYDNLLLGWSQQSLQSNVIFHAGNSRYSYAASDARQAIITNFSWTITDGDLEFSSPGPFTLSSNANTPDDNGEFRLMWTSSAGADNYSVYHHSSYITEINGSLILLADEITELSLILSNYLHGSYYFIVVAHNEYGDTLSNCITVVVDLSPRDFTLSSNASTPDTDGTFTLTWNSSAGADNYSVYRHSSYIMEINGSLTLLANEITELSLILNNYVDGTYYFIVVAHNEYGDTLSNCIEVTVLREGSTTAYPIISGYVLGFIIVPLGVAIAIVIMKKHTINSQT